jgi:hypothetical protein
MTLSEIERVTFRIEAQDLKQLRHRVISYTPRPQYLL